MKFSFILFIICAIIALTLTCNAESLADHLNHTPLDDAKEAGFEGDEIDMLERYENFRADKYLSLYTKGTAHQMNVLMYYGQMAHLFQSDPKGYNYLVKMLFPMVRGWIQDNLNVRGNGITTPDSRKCYKAQVPSEMYQTNVQADLIIFVTASNDDESYVAWATACQLDQNSRRPNMGQVHINLKYLDVKFSQIYDVFGTVIHEVVHILGMSSSLYAHWIDADTGRVLGKSNVMKKDQNGKAVIVTPKVQAFTRRHFNCNTLLGAAIEDEGGSGSKGSHWEKRYWGSEFMSAATVENPVISELTVSMFEDSGWYIFRKGETVNGKVIDYEPLFWLQGYGCAIYTDACPTATHSCSTRGETGCSYDNTFKGGCSSSTFSNSCSYFTPYNPFEKSDCRFHDANNNKQGQEAARYLNSQGPNRRCFNGKISDTVSGWTKSSNFCF